MVWYLIFICHSVTDIAVGSPYEDDGAGAVYIFNGKLGQMSSESSQVIKAKSLFPGIKSFGTYISLPFDIDNNQYPGTDIHIHLMKLNVM